MVKEGFWKIEKLKKENKGQRNMKTDIQRGQGNLFGIQPYISQNGYKL